MSATIAHCNTEVKRLLGGLPLVFGIDREVTLKLLAQVLRGHCSDDQHASAVVARVIETRHQCPTPAELAGLCGEIPREDGMPRGCAKCRSASGQEWDDFIHVYSEAYGREQHVANFSGRCSCARGRYLRALDITHAHK